MYKVLIVEDDMNFRYAIRETIPWTQNGFEVAGEAIHGKQALQFLEKHHVDIVLTDMSMPQMNGVELTREVSNMYPEIKVVALSAYDDFTFVKDSLKYGAKDYILKQDMKPEMVIDILKKICSDDEVKQIQKNNIEEQENQLRHAIKHHIRPDDIILNSLQNRMASTRYFAIMIKEKKDNLSQILSAYKKDKRVIYVICDQENHILSFWKLEGSVSSENIREQMNTISEQIVLEQNVGRVFVSKDSSTNRNAGELLEELFELEDIELYFDNEKILPYSVYENYIQKRNKNFSHKMTVKNDIADWDEIKDELEKMIQMILKELPDLEHCNLCFVNYCEAVSQILKFNDFRQIKVYEKIGKYSKLDDKKQYCESILTEMWNDHCSNMEAGSPEIVRAMKYIRIHFAEDISLQDIAEEVGLSENYLSNLFKAEKQENLTHFINSVRIEKAKQYMDETNLKVYQIAEKVGYRNATYFSTIFKKITNMQVSEYRKKK